MTYIDTCPDCTHCESCGRAWCPNEEPSPGEGDGLCATCWMTSEDGEDHEPTDREVPC